MATNSRPVRLASKSCVHQNPKLYLQNSSHSHDGRGPPLDSVYWNASQQVLIRRSEEYRFLWVTRPSLDGWRVSFLIIVENPLLHNWVIASRKHISSRLRRSWLNQRRHTDAPEVVPIHVRGLATKTPKSCSLRAGKQIRSHLRGSGCKWSLDIDVFNHIQWIVRDICIIIKNIVINLTEHFRKGKQIRSEISDQLRLPVHSITFRMLLREQGTEERLRLRWNAAVLCLLGVADKISCVRRSDRLSV